MKPPIRTTVPDSTDRPSEGEIVAVYGSPGPWAGITVDVAYNAADGQPHRINGIRPENKGPKDNAYDVYVEPDACWIKWRGDRLCVMVEWQPVTTDCAGALSVRPVTPGLPPVAAPGGTA